MTTGQQEPLLATFKGAQNGYRARAQGGHETITWDLTREGPLEHDIHGPNALGSGCACSLGAREPITPQTLLNKQMGTALPAMWSRTCYGTWGPRLSQSLL